MRGCKKATWVGYNNCQNCGMISCTVSNTFSQETVQGSFETCEMMINYYWKKLYPPEKHDILQDLLVNNPINQEWMSKLVEWARRAILISFRR